MANPPNVKKPEDTTPGGSSKWGGPDAVHVAELLMGQHASEKIQISAIDDLQSELNKKGIAVKEPCRAATTVNGNLNSSFDNNSVIDGVRLVTGDRILIKNQNDRRQNGIYVVNASGAPMRVSDFDSGDEIKGAVVVFVQSGTQNSYSGFILTVAGSITVGGTNLVFKKFADGGSNPELNLRYVLDSNGKIVLSLGENNNARNYVKIDNASAGSPALISASGTDANVDLKLDPRGTGSIDVSNSKIKNVNDPIGDQDAATKNYVDSAIQGLDTKESVRVASTVNGNLATAYRNGSVVDTIRLVTGDRILLKNQVPATQNGIYVVNASGAPMRAEDADSSEDIHSGMYVWVEEGGANGDHGFILTNNGDITLGTTNLTFTQFSGVGRITAGQGLTKTGNTLDVDQTVIRTVFNQVITGRKKFTNIEYNQLNSADGGVLDFAGRNLENKTIVGHLTFTTLNKNTGRTKTVKIKNNSSVARIFTFPSEWVFIGRKPSELAAGKVGVLSLMCFGTGENDVVASYAAEE